MPQNRKQNKTTFNDNEIEDIISSYIMGESSVSIGKRYKTTHKPILRVLHKMNIEVDQKRFVRKYKLKEHYFDDIDSQNKAYIFGLLYADGCNCIDKSTISISLQESDKKILESIKSELGSDKPLEFIDYSKKQDFGIIIKTNIVYCCLANICVKN